jgi:hypothetical protein
MKRFMGFVFMVSLLKEAAFDGYGRMNRQLWLRRRRLGREMMKDARVGFIEGRAGRLGIGDRVFDFVPPRIGYRRTRTHRQ